MLSMLCANPANLTDEMRTNLLMKLSQSYPELGGFVNCSIQLYGTDTPFPSGISNFILAISKNTPICAIFRPIDKLQALFVKILQGHHVKRHPYDMLLLQNKCPLFFGLVVEIDDSTLTTKMQDLLRILLKIAAAPYQTTVSPVDSTGLDSSAIVDSLTYFPSLPRVRARGCYNSDRQRNSSEVICNKKAGRHPTLLPGIFLVHCKQSSELFAFSCHIFS